MFITLDFSEVYAGLGLAVLAASVATPVQFRLYAALPPWPRAIAASMGSIGFAGLLSLPVATRNGMTETSLFALLGSSLLQAALLPILFFFARKG